MIKPFALALLLLIFCYKGQSQTTYKDVAPIFAANCTGCHHQGGITFPLTTYGTVKPFGPTISNALQNNIMPPWPADPTYRHYAHERVLSPNDKSAILTWISNNMPVGDTSQLPPVPVYGSYQLKGTPDLIVALPKFTSSATISDHYYCVNASTNLPQDRYIRAFEFVPGNASIIHHAVITIDTTGTATDDMSGNCFNFQGQVNIGDYAPGMGPTLLPGVTPVKFGFRLKANSKISVQLHVPEGTVGQRDSSQLRIYFYPPGETGIRNMVFQTILQNWSFSIPANSVATVTQKYPTGTGVLPTDIVLYGAFPHSHTTCRSIVNYAYKGTDTIPLIRINKWDFHWQMQYTFKNLLKVPAGYKFFSSHVFDNTTNNPNTPDASKPVLVGTSTTNEMLFDSYLFASYQPGDELINIDSLIQADPLYLKTGLTVQRTSEHEISVFPNPFSSSLVTEEPSIVTYAALFDMQGTQVWSGVTTNGADFSDLQSGLYCLVLHTATGKKTFKLIKS